jgi:hypothetical protein
MRQILTPYPATPENTAYQNEWNTRNYPGPFADALRSGGSTIISSHSSATVTGNGEVGGLAGQNNGKEIRYSYFTGNVTGNWGTGGIAGTNYSPTGWIHDSYSTGNVTGNSETGGLVGRNEAKIERTYSAGTVTSPGSYTGGLVGLDMGWSQGIFDSFTTAVMNVTNGNI